MAVYFEYLLKASICQAIVFLFYSLLLKRMTYYTWNRYFLSIFSVLSFMVPYIDVDVFAEAQQQSTISFINQIPSIAAHPLIANYNNNLGDLNYLLILSIVYLVVFSILFLRLSIQLLSIRKIKLKATLMVDGEVKIYHLSEPILPFSFLNSIFINKDNYSKDELQKIIDHEQVHAEQKHTLDVLVTEIICIVNWFNPFVWLIRKAVRENLEFIADDGVIQKGVDKKNYQYLLLKVTGNIPSSIASNFTFSSLKNRIFMMNKTKTSGFHLLKFVLLVPMIVFLLLAFRSRKEIKPEVKTTEAETYTLSTLTYSIPDEKVKAIVLKEKDKSLLKAGVVLNLKQIFIEKDRLKSLLERTGYNNLKSNAIMFWIDTISVKNSFSIEIKIDVEPPAISSVNEIPVLFNSEMISINYNAPVYQRIPSKSNIISVWAANIRSEKFLNYSYSNNRKTVA